MAKKYNIRNRKPIKTHMRPTTTAVKIIGAIQIILIIIFLASLWCKIVFKTEISNILWLLLAGQLIIGFIANKIKPE